MAQQDFIPTNPNAENGHHPQKQCLERQGLTERGRDGIWIIAANAITLYANSRMAEILGTTVDDLIGQPSFDYVFTEDLGAAQELFDRKKTGDREPFDFALRRRDGSPLRVTVWGRPMFAPGGEFIGIHGTFHVSNSAGPTGRQ